MKKKYIATFLLFIVALPFFLNPKNFSNIFAPIFNDQYLLSQAIVEERDSGFLTFKWSRTFLRQRVSHREFDFEKKYRQNQSAVQFILSFYNIEMHEEDKAYIFALAERAILGGADINNVADNGLSALHEAVLNQHLDVVAFLVAQGVQCDILIHRPGKKSDKLNVVKFAEYLSWNDAELRQLKLKLLNGCSAI